MQDPSFFRCRFREKGFVALIGMDQGNELKNVTAAFIQGRKRR